MMNNSETREFTKRLVVDAWVTCFPDKDINESTKEDWHRICGYLSDILTSALLSMPDDKAKRLLEAARILYGP
jgi:hypothetical protein